MKGLCFRCEHRAMFHEEGMRPRMECGDIEHSSCACYMYKPVKPVTVGIAPGYEGRKGLRDCGAMIRPRESVIEVAHCSLSVENDGDNRTYYWVPKKVEDKK